MGDSVFSIVIGGWLDSSNFLKRSLLKTFFLIILQNFHNSSFSNIPSKMYERYFFSSVWLIKWLYYRPFSCRLPTISEYSKETFFLEPVFAEVRNSGLQGCSVRKKKGQFCKDVFGIFEILEYPFLFEHFENVSVVQLGSIVGCRLYSCNSKENSTTYVFLTIFQKFRRSFFQMPS